MENFLAYKIKTFKNIDIDVIDEIQLRALVDDALTLVGIPNPELRDGVLYPFLENVISNGILPNTHCSDILHLCLGDSGLYYKLGEFSDAVFRRAFCSLIIAAILDANTKNKFLSVDTIDLAFVSVLDYLEKEIDTRGYVSEKGWAHAMAHGADMLQCLVQSPQIDDGKFLDILSVIETCLFKDTATYIDQEEERFVGVVKAMMDKGLQGTVIERWITLMLSRMANLYDAEGLSYRYYRANVNVTNFLKALYFRLKIDGERLKLRVFIYESVKKLQKLYSV
ncbi:MAG: DUF2785 domain-containing protein [Defluviitaleaceae bacterium]|nr:DUF2785 domain-containing protein [Defluviitaleaceae bacterium]